MGDNVRQNQILVDILERCVIQLGILVAQGQKGGPLTTQEYVQAQLDIWQVIEKMHVTHQEHRSSSGWEEKSHMGRHVVCRALQADGTDGACCGKHRASRYPVREKGRIRGIFPLAQADEAEEKSYAVPKLREQNVR